MLAHAGTLWQEPAACRAFPSDSHLPAACCRSSVVEHSLGKGEVDSSILSGSTRFFICSLQSDPIVRDGSLQATFAIDQFIDITFGCVSIRHISESAVQADNAC